MQILQDGKRFDVMSDLPLIDKLPVGNYEFRFGPMGQIWIVNTQDTIIPAKIYSNDQDFIDHVIKTWKDSTGSIGIALVGEKGLGKSFTGNILSTQVNLPVIRITPQSKSPAIFSYLNKIEQDMVVFIDEFEKIFPSDHERHNNPTGEAGMTQQDFLTFLDGGSERAHRVMFIITSNSSYKINDFLKDRPSRLRYFKEYKSLPDVIIREVIDDLLVDASFKADLIEHLPYSGLNIDVLIQIIKEINYHNKAYSSFKSFFNFKGKDTPACKVWATVPGLSGDICINQNLEYDVDTYETVGMLGGNRPIYAYENIYLDKQDQEELQGYYFDTKDPEKEIKVKLRLEKNQVRIHSSLVM